MPAAVSAAVAAIACDAVVAAPANAELVTLPLLYLSLLASCLYGCLPDSQEHVFSLLIFKTPPSRKDDLDPTASVVVATKITI